MSLIFILLLVLISSSASGAMSEQTGYGLIWNEAKNPIANCLITLNSGNTKTLSTSDSMGRFDIPVSLEKTFQLSCKCDGYPLFRLDSAVAGDSLMIIEMKLWQENLSEVTIGIQQNHNFFLPLPGTSGIERIRLTGSQILSKGLCFQSGLRVETNCQTCNFTQVRLNGMPGAYTQIVVNGHSVFGSLSGLYALDFFPVPIISKIELHPGGGPLQFGGSSIGGSINLITDFPEQAYLMFSQQSEIINQSAHQHHMYLAGGLPVKNSGTSLSFFISRKDGTAFDANRDGFTELSKRNSNTGGVHVKTVERKSTTEIRTLYMNEYRRGGDRLNAPILETTQAEERIHHVASFDISQQISLPRNIEMNWYSAAQFTYRRHYTGSFGAPGKGISLQGSEQAGLLFSKKYELADNRLSLKISGGADYLFDGLKDEVPGYGYSLKQKIHQTGAFAELNTAWKRKILLETGLRVQFHNQVSRAIPLSRFRLIYRPIRTIEASIQYQIGFRGPQAFDSDLHMAFAAGGVSRVMINPDLKEEKSHSVSGGLGYNIESQNFKIGVKLNGFFTLLKNNVLLEQAGTDENGNLILWKTNGSGSTVRGFNFEFGSKWFNAVGIDGGYTFQKSRFNSVWFWSEKAEGVKEMLRTPDHYGFITITMNPGKHFTLITSAVFTGSMNIPHLGGSQENPVDRLYKSGIFADIQIRFRYNIQIPGPSNLSLSAGCNNLLNDYQKRFDTGPGRDSNFIYGPSMPRNFALGIEWNMSFAP